MRGCSWCSLSSTIFFSRASHLLLWSSSMLSITHASSPSCRPSSEDLEATGVRILMRVGMSLSVSFSCAWFAIMNLHIIRTHSNGMCGRNTVVRFPYQLYCTLMSCYTCMATLMSLSEYCVFLLYCGYKAPTLTNIM